MILLGPFVARDKIMIPNPMNYQDPSLPSGHRENDDIADTDEEMQKILDECEEEDEKLTEEVIN